MKNAAQPKLFSTRHEREFASLRDLSARVGSDPLLVQASNGNTSIKLDGILWIKASGKWLAHATQEEMFVPLELAEVKESVQNDTEIAPRYAPKDELRPSIETAMHAILRHRVVIHVHSINAIAWAIRLDGPDPTKRTTGRPALAMDSVRSVRHTASSRNRKGSGRCDQRLTFSYLEITDWSSVDRIAIRPKSFCVRSNDGLRLLRDDSQSPTPRCWR